MNREELLALYGDPMPVLDHGHVRLVDVMGDDERIEAAARLSYQTGTRKASDTRGLIRYLMRHRHTTPFEKPVIELDLKMPIFVARQLVRHRTQSINEMSARYSILPDEFYTPTPSQVCYQDQRNRQGRAAVLPAEDAEEILADYEGGCEWAFANYRSVLEKGVARETARMHLPLSTYTQWWTTMNLHNLFHMLALRLDEHAQWETRQYAEAIARIVADWCPLAWEAFVDYRLKAVSLSQQEADAVRSLLVAHAQNLRMKTDDEKDDLLRRTGAAFDISKRELDEFVAKMCYHQAEGAE